MTSNQHRIVAYIRMYQSENLRAVAYQLEHLVKLGVLVKKGPRNRIFVAPTDVPA